MSRPEPDILLVRGNLGTLYHRTPTTKHARRRLRTFTEFIVLPGLLVLAIAVTEILQHLEFGIGIALLAGTLIPLVTIVVAERLLPARDEWNRSHQDVSTDAAHNATIFLLLGSAFPLILQLFSWMSQEISATLGFSLWPEFLWFPLQIVFALVIAEAVPYWIHRFQHKVPFLWQFHSIHHSAPRLYWFNTYRFHIVDLLIITVPRFAVPLALGIPEQVAVYYLLIAYVIAFLEHSNVAVRTRWISWFLTTPELHRWHHSKLQSESDNNYGQTVIVWDLLFGTRLLPTDKAMPDSLGLESPEDFPKTYWRQLIRPFRYV